MAWAFLTRANSERDLIDELGEGFEPRQIGAGVVLAEGRPRGSDGAFVELAFARQAMRADDEAKADPTSVVKVLVQVMAKHRAKNSAGETWTWALQIVAPDSADPHDPRRRIVTGLVEADVEQQLVTALDRPTAGLRTAVGDADRLVQVWPVDGDDVLIGVTPGAHVLSREPGGKIRLRKSDDAPSRAALKLEEAIAWIGVGPDRGDHIADLGAAPGGWTKVALDLGASVIAIDPANLKIEGSKKRLTHLKQSAFDYAPEETLDWVLCDMAWRPREVALLLAKWGRRAWARQMYVNFKLPMKTKHAMLAEILKILRKAGWEGLRARQLYHDRDEVTVFGWLNAGHLVRGMLAPFEMHKKPSSSGAPRTKGPGARRSRSADSNAQGPRSKGPRSGGTKAAGSRGAGSKSGGSKAAGSRGAGSKSGGSKSGGSKSGGSKSGGPRSAGTKAAGSRSGGPRSKGPRSGGARSGGPRSGGPRSKGPRSSGPKRPSGGGRRGR